VQAERDFNRVVKNNDTLKVGFETADKGDQTIEIKNDRASSRPRPQGARGNNDHTVTVDNNLDDGIDRHRSTKASRRQGIGTTIVIEAGTSIELKVGGSSIKIEAGQDHGQVGGDRDRRRCECQVKAGAMMNVKSGAPMSVKSDAIVTIEGALVKIN
jgi:type VI secretion system secreted protein VgrG